VSRPPSPPDGANEQLSPLKRALLAMERLQARVEQLEGERTCPLAVVGIGCRFPAGDGPDAYWAALRAGVDAVRERPPVERPGFPAADAPSPFPPAGYLPHDISAFDPGFFGISPREAASIDPQQRLVLEVAWEALEHAGIDPLALEGSRTGVFVGMAGNDYAQMQLSSERAAELLGSHFASGIGHSMASGRISWLLGLQGPAITVDTACSSSLVATHLACQSLRAGESDLALAAGTNLILSNDFTTAFQQSRMLAPDGRCKTFDAAADGFGRGEGCGVVVLRRLDDALRSGDRILAVVRGSAVNQDGPSSGLTAPSGPAQEAVMREALAQAGLSPDDIGYVEAHGTGTSLGDPIEIRALSAVFGRRDDPLAVGSVKTNMGHLEAAAGIAGLIKLVLSLRAGELAPHLHLQEPSPHIPWAESSLTVPTSPSPFPARGGRRRGAVSSFGFSGTNAHLILEEAPEVGPGADGSGATAASEGAAGLPEPPVHVVTVSAPTNDGLRESARRYASHLAGTTDALGDIAHAAGAGRAHFAHRLAVVASDTKMAANALDRWSAGETVAQVRSGSRSRTDRPAVAFLYTGQGAQHPGMGSALYRASPIFRRQIDRCAEILGDRLEVPLLELLDPDGPRAELVHRTDLTQPALFALQHALTELWGSWGVRPDVVLGHSIGEFAAARVAGVFSLEDALNLVAARGRAMYGVSRPGRMLAVMAPEARVTDWISDVGGELSLAAVNAPAQTVVSGAIEAVGAIEALASEAGIRTKALHTSHAFHSPLMEGARSGMEEALSGVRLNPASRVRFISTVTGGAVRPDDLTDPGYWVGQIRKPVRFAEAVEAASALVERAVEIGPHPALSGLVGQSDLGLPVHPSLHRNREAWETILGSVADLHVSGVDPDWSALPDDRPRRRSELPVHPFQRIRLWVDMGEGRREDVAGSHPLIGSERPRPGDGRDFQRVLRAEAPAFIGEHRVLGRVLLPGTGFIEMALAAAGRALGRRASLEQIDFVAPLFLDSGPRRVHTETRPADGGSMRVEIHSTPASDDDAAGWTLHASGTALASTERPAPPRVDLDALRARCARKGDVDALYRSMSERGFELGPRFRTLAELRVGDDESVTRIRLPEACADDPVGYRVHPLLLDAALQSVGPALGEPDGRSYLPLAVGSVTATSEPFSEAWVHARVVERGDRTAAADLRLLDDAGGELARLEGVRFRRVESGDLAAESDDPFLRVQWVSEPSGTTPPTADPAVRNAVAEGALATLSREADREDASAYDDFVHQLESRAGAWVGHAFGALGWAPEPGAQVELASVAERLGVASNRHRLLDRCLDILAEEGTLEPLDEGWRVVRVPDSAPPAVGAGVEGSGDTPPELVLLERCGPHLAEALRGNVDPLELLFPGGDGSVAEEMYYDAPAARIFNRAVAEAVATAARHGDRPLRILEIGAGTGGTTRRILDRLAKSGDAAGREVEYHFTDISGLFVERARRRFESHPGMRFHTFDLDRPAAEQGLDSGGFDLVVAANCLHAARDLTGAVRSAGELLRPGGMLLAVEVFYPHRWFDLTVGLTDGWWHFTDADLRDDYPCVPPSTWRSLLEDTGFEHARVVPLSETSDAHGTASSGQGLVMAVRAVPRADGPWLLVGEDAGLAGRVAARLEAHGADVEVRDVGASGRDAVDGVARIVEQQDRWAGVIHCGGAVRGPSLDPDALRRRLRRDAASLLGVVRAIARGTTSVGEVGLVTRGGVRVDEHDGDLDPVGGALQGMLRSARLELADVPLRALDLDPARADAREVEAIHRWISEPDRQPELALRGAHRMAPRLVPSVRRDASGPLPAEYRLRPPTSGSLDDLAFDEGSRTPPGPGQVEIRVAASGLNFKDVLNVLGMYPGDPGPLGSECAGVVTAVGEGVDLAPGTAVVAAAGHAYGRHVVADATLVAPRPAGLSFAEAATLPVAYLTAHFALNHLGRLGPHDRVLIHAAAGGVGSAACALAARVGAKIFATAGSEEKRARLRARGIDHVFDSRSDEFVAGVMAATGGEGATVVLNSLADELVDRTFDVAARGARFLEIGKRGIWSPERVADLDRDIEYNVIDWGRTHEQEPEVVGALFREVMTWVGDDALGALPVTVFPLEEASDAFRFMANARHVGKIVLTHPVASVALDLETLVEGTILVTGGRSGLGFETVRWLAERGARSVVIAARGEPDAKTRRAIDDFSTDDVDVRVRRCDVGDPAAVGELMGWIADELPPLTAVIHSAGTLADRTLGRIEWEDFEMVFRAKVEGSLNVGSGVAAPPLQLFLAYSSIAAVLGSPGQANHAAANGFMDLFAATRWQEGVQGASIAWGPWSETGSATADETLERTRSLGIDALTTRQGIDRVERFFRAPEPHPVAMRLTDPAALAAARGGSLLDELVDAVTPERTPGGRSSDEETGENLPSLLAATPVDARRGVLLRRVRDRVRAVLGMAADAPLDPERPLGEVGLDSLLAVELKNVLGNEVERRLPATLLFDYPTLAALTDHLLILLFPAVGASDAHDATSADGVEAEPTPSREPDTDTLGAVESLSDDEVDRLLAEQFERND